MRLSGPIYKESYIHTYLSDDTIVQCLVYLSLITSVLTLFLGLVSWIKYSKYRKYENFVFLNTILACFLLIIVYFYIFRRYIISSTLMLYFFYWILLMTFAIAFNTWLCIASAMFYLQIVQVFGARTPRRYVKCVLCAWVSPLVAAVLITVAINLFQYDSPYSYYLAELTVVIIIFCPLVVNVVLYTFVLRALLKSPNVQTRTRIHFATFIFVMTGSGMLAGILNLIFGKSFYAHTIITLVQSLMINVYYLLLKSNWALWGRACRCSRRSMPVAQASPLQHSPADSAEDNVNDSFSVAI